MRVARGRDDALLEFCTLAQYVIPSFVVTKSPAMNTN